MNRFLRNLRHTFFLKLVCKKTPGLITLGTPPCAWTIYPKNMNAKSIVYSAGVGSDISFEKDLVRQYGCKILLLDPSSTGKFTMSQAENQSPALDFRAIGLAGQEGEHRFAAEHLRDGSFYKTSSTQASIAMPCTTIQSLMKENGHAHIDFLKLDIEGFEYEVLDHILDHHLRIDQICVEYHHWLIDTKRPWPTVRSILKLIKAGYRLAYVNTWDFTFIHSSLNP